MTYDDLIFGFQSKCFSLNYFKQVIVGYEERLNTAATKDPNEDPNDYPVLLIPPQNSRIRSDKVEVFNTFSIAGHKRAKHEKKAEITIASNVVTFTTSVFKTGDFIVFEDSRTYREIPLKITSVVAGLATATSYINIEDGTIFSIVEEDHSAIQEALIENMRNIIAAVGSGFTAKSGASVAPQAIGRDMQVFRLDNYSSRGYIRVVIEFSIDNKNCKL